MDIRLLDRPDAAEFVRLRFEALIREPHVFARTPEDPLPWSPENIASQLRPVPEGNFPIGALRRFAHDGSGRLLPAGSRVDEDPPARVPAPGPLLGGETDGYGPQRITAPAADARADLRVAGIGKDSPDGVLVSHSWRATYGNLLDSLGASAKETQELMRHSTPMLTMQRYVQA